MPSSRSLFDELEPGPLRDEIFAEQAAAEKAEQLRLAQEQEALLARGSSERLVFSGDGGEYFRIWIVNLALTVATLGVYSAWAKVRKTQYFWQNTQLRGHRFNYHGSPIAILRGRILAVVLLVAYSWSFDISATVALATLGLLCLLAPWLFLRAQEFKLRNTSYRGLRFSFDMRMRNTYPRLLVLPLIWFSGTIMSLLFAQQGPWLIALTLVPLLLFPWMHYTLKKLQHSRTSYGSVEATFSPCVGDFYGTYALVAVAFVFALALSVVGAVLAAVPVTIGLASLWELEKETVIITGSAIGTALVLLCH